MKEYLIADLFCGAGGSSTGAERAVKALDAKMVLVCINHWPLAIETHRKNHPTARHYIEDITVARPEELVPEGLLDLLMASPECTHFSRARGGKPVDNQSRMNPWSILNWLTKLDVRAVLIENVPEFIDWGPVDCDGRPLPDMKGIFFEAWIKAIKTLGYRLAWRFLNAADYGDATTRRRFFLIARKTGAITWPVPTHSKDGGGSLIKWRAARDIIIWENAGRSLLDDPKYQKHPLSINTRRRIARGLEKYGGVYAPLYIRLLGLSGDAGGAGWPEAFTIQNRAHATPRSMGQPIHTVTATYNGGQIFVKPTAEPFILGQQSCSAARDTGKPIPTVAKSGAIALVDPQLVVFHGASNTRPVDKPMPCQPTKSKIGLVQPQIVKYYGTKQDTNSIEAPLDTVTTKDRFGLVEPTAEPFILQNRIRNDGDRVYSINNPMNTITGHGCGALVNPVIVEVNHNGHRKQRTIDEPISTMTTKRNIGLVEPVLKNVIGDSEDIDPRRMVLVDGVPHILDIRFRMLANRELARAMGFGDQETEYEFLGTVAEVTKQIGNAVPVNLAAALVKEILSK